MRNPRHSNSLEKELRGLHLPTPALKKKRPSSPSVFSENIVDKWLKNYYLRREVEDSYYEDFVESYLAWLDFSGPAIRQLEEDNERSRPRTTDVILSQLWEKSLVVHRPKLEKLCEQGEVARAMYEKRVGPLAVVVSEVVEDEEGEMSDSTVAETEGF
jgi:hypothetical protein